MISELSAAQWQQVTLERERWLRIGTCTDLADRETTEGVITDFYRRLRRDQPRFIWCDGPLSCCVLGPLVLAISGDSQLRSQLSDQLYSQLGGQLSGQLNSQLYSQLGDQLGDQLYSQLNSQLNSHCAPSLLGHARDDPTARRGALLRSPSPARVVT